ARAGRNTPRPRGTPRNRPRPRPKGPPPPPRPGASSTGGPPAIPPRAAFAPLPAARPVLRNGQKEMKPWQPGPISVGRREPGRAPFGKPRSLQGAPAKPVSPRHRAGRRGDPAIVTGRFRKVSWQSLHACVRGEAVV